MYKFIETFFFISLVITFILLSLLFYHFKQRLIDVEQKSCRLFEIIENVVKEMTVLKCTCMTSKINSVPQSCCDPKQSDGNTSPFDYGFSKLIVSDDEDSDDVDSGEEESDDEDSENDDEESEDEEGQIETDVTISSNKDGIHFELSELLEESQIEVISEETEIQYNEIPDVTTDALEVSEIQEKTNENTSDEPNHESSTAVEETIHEQREGDNQDTITQDGKEPVISNFQKLSMKELKAIAVAKGITIDPSKHKKNDLIQMLSE